MGEREGVGAGGPSSKHAYLGGEASVNGLTPGLTVWTLVESGWGSPLRQGCLVPSAPAGPVGCEVGRGTQVRSELRWGPRVLGKACRKEEEKIQDSLYS